MRFLSSFLMLVSSSAFCDPSILSAPGSYAPESWEVAQKTHVENIYFAAPGAAERIAELRREGFTCVRTPSSFVQCKARQTADATEPALVTLAQAQMASLHLTVGPIASAPVRLNPGASIEEWQVEQSFSLHDKIYPRARYIVGQNIEKIFLGEPAEETLLPVASDQIDFVFFSTLSRSSTVYDLYLLRIHLRRSI